MNALKWTGYLALAAAIGCAIPGLAREPQKPVSNVPAAQNLIDQAWAAQDQEMGLKQIDATIKFEEQALALDPNNPELLVELADEYYQRGEQMPRNNDSDYEARKPWFLKGYEYAAKAMAIKETAGAHYWLAANLASTHENANIIRQASLFPELTGHLDWIDQHDKNYKYGASARMMSRIAARVPDALIKMVGYDTQTIFAALEAAIVANPAFLDNYAYKAEFYQRMGKTKEALDVLDQLLKLDPEAFPQERAYNRYAQQKARRYWKEWSGKEYPNR